MTKGKGNSRNKSKTAMPRTLHDIPDNLLELILRHLTSPLCIIHAAATCRRWRRIITGWRFLGHLNLYPPQVAGHYHLLPISGGSCPSFVTASSTIAINSRYFSLEFLPGGGSKSWKLADSNRSFLLLAKKKSGWMRHRFPDLIVCEPLTRRYHLIPRPAHMKYFECLGVFLNDCSDDMSYFSVTCVLYQRYTGISDEVGTARACVFWKCQRKVGSWKIGRPAAMDGVHLNLQGKDSLQFVGCAACSSFWWVKDEMRPVRLVCVDRTWFSFVSLPEHIQRLCVDTSSFRVAGGRDSIVRIVCLEGKSNLKIFARNYQRGGNYEWTQEKHLNLSMVSRGLQERKEEYFGNIATNIVTVSGHSIVLALAGETRLFSFEVGTMKVAPWNMGIKRSTVAYSYELPWPPRSVLVCTTVGEGAKGCVLKFLFVNGIYVPKKI